MASTLSRRLPVSCENCRQRKIRCLSSDDRAPCDTCLRRGYASTCWFKRGEARQTPIENSETWRQISTLETLLKENIELTKASMTQNKHYVRAPVSPVSDLVIRDSPAQSQNEDTGLPVTPSGRLLVSTTNHVRYVPFNSSADATLLDAMQEPVRDTLADFPFAAGGSVDRRELLHSLPPARQCDELKAIFLDVFSPLFHILHEPSFQTKYQAFKQDPQSAPLSFIGLLFVALSLAITSLDDQHPLLADLGHESTPMANLRGLAAKYRSAAMRCLVADNFMFQHNLCTLQCLVLLIYAFSHSHGPTWSLLGTTLHIAIAIGLSIDPEYLNVDIIEAEERRRCWAALTMLYTIQSTCYGHIMPFKIQPGVALPADVDDEELLGSPATDSMSSSPPPRLTKMSYLLCKFRLYHIAYDICQLSSSAALPHRALTMDLDERLAVELKRHMDLFESISNLPVYHVAHFYIVSNYTNHLFLLLHRPYLGAIESPSPGPLTTQIQESCQRCYDSAMNILSNLENLRHNPELKPYHWYINGLGSFHAFFAVSTLLVILAKGDIPSTSTLAITTAINTCMASFKSMSARSEICTKAIAILEPVLGAQSLPMPAPTPSSILTGTAAPDPLQDQAVPDVWNSIPLPQIESLVRDISCEQWLMPSGFPWGSV